MRRREHGAASCHCASKEIPPRMRRRVAEAASNACFPGNTSAYAEKRENQETDMESRRKYLRVCGEEIGGTVGKDANLEIPPRMRRRARVVVPISRARGNTSAYAEKSPTLCGCRRHHWKYLRVCGEESSRPAVFTKKFLQVREFRQIRSQAATDHRSPESLGDYSPSYLRRTPALGWDHY